MKKENSVCQIVRNDFEKYSLHLPARVWFGRRREKFISSELEKRHPCFSDECCFDVKTHLTGKGINSDVVVMNKLKLAEYRQRFPKRRLFIGNEGKQFYVFDKKKKLFCAVVCCLAAFLFVMILLCGIIFTGTPNESGLRLVETENTAAFENVSKTVETGSLKNDAELNDDSIGKKIILETARLGGKFAGFEWKSDGIKETVTASVLFLYPEELDKVGEIKTGTVNYTDGKPAMQIDLHKKLRQHLKSDSGPATDVVLSEVLPLADVKKSLRKIITQNGGRLKSEAQKPASFVFEFSYGSFLNSKKFFEDFQNCVCKNGLAVSKINISQKNSSDVSIEISLEEKLPFELGIEIAAVGKTPGIFLLKQAKSLQQKNQKTSVQNAIAVKAEEQNILPAAVNSEVNAKKNSEPKRKKLGQIIFKDGSRKTFFKNENGKITFELEVPKK